MNRSKKVSLEEDPSGPTIHDNNDPSLVRRDWRFWAVFVPLALAVVLSALESTVVSTVLPFISHELNAGNLYVWFVNGYFLTLTAFQPLYGQFAQLFGRRWVLMGSVAIFALGSGLSGGAFNAAMLVAGRAIQGIGGAGISLLTNMVVSDLVPVRERGKFSSILFGFFTIGAAIGPVVGGLIVERTTWRWVFYLNIPIAGACLLMLYIFLQVLRPGKQAPLKETLSRIDFIGNIILLSSVVSVLIALSYGGISYSWSSWHVLVPLIVGLAGTILFHVYETYRFCVNPVLPAQIFTNNRTTTIALILSFNQYLLSYWIIYFMPVYFQGVILQSPERSGALLLPFVLFSVPITILVGILLSKTGRYKFLHIAGFGLLTIGIGLLIKLDQHSSAAEYIIFQLIAATGMGAIMSTLLPAVQAGLDEKDVAVVTASWGYLRSYGGVMGVAIPAVIFDTRFQSRLSQNIDDADVIATFSGGVSYSQVSSYYIQSLSPAVRNEVIDTYVYALRIVWIVAASIAGLSFILCFFEREVALRTTIQSDYGLKNKDKTGMTSTTSTNMEDSPSK